MSWQEKVKSKLKYKIQEMVYRTFPEVFLKEQSFEKLLSSIAGELMLDDHFRKKIREIDKVDEKIFTIINLLLNRIFCVYIQRLQTPNSLHVVKTIKEIIAMVCSNLFVSFPYFFSYFQQSSDKFILRDVRKAFQLQQAPKLVLITDTFFDINGVAKTIRKMIIESKKRKIDFTVVTCLSQKEQEIHCQNHTIQQWIKAGRLKIFTSIQNLDFPEYDGLQIRFLPFLELIKYLQEEGFTQMQISTPGTIGVAGLIASKILQLPTSATYHTSFPEYVENYTHDKSLEALTWRYMMFFYHAVDEVVVPSKFIAKLLHERGLRNRKLLILDRWVDTKQYTPENRRAEFWRTYNIQKDKNLVTFIYVGRIGVEKDLQILAEAFQQVFQHHKNIHLIFVGGGPYRDELKQQLTGYPVTFTGFLKGKTLARAYASADVKVFPSTTDTWGNSPLEAQASGLPVIVSDKGGPQELMQHEITGLVFKAKNVQSLSSAMIQMLALKTRKKMGAKARAFIENNDVESPYSAILAPTEYRKNLKQMKKIHKYLQQQETLDLLQENHRVPDPQETVEKIPLT